VNSGDDKHILVEEQVLEVLTSASYKEKRTIREDVAFSKQPAKADPIEITTPKNTHDPKEPRSNALALDPGNQNALSPSYLHYTILGRQERETGKLTFRLLPKAKMVSVPMNKRVTIRIPAAPEKIGIAHVSTFSLLKRPAGYTEFRYVRASATVFE
jgi:hypothetical protein